MSGEKRRAALGNTASVPATPLPHRPLPSLQTLNILLPSPVLVIACLLTIVCYTIIARIPTTVPAPEIEPVLDQDRIEDDDQRRLALSASYRGPI